MQDFGGDVVVIPLKTVAIMYDMLTKRGGAFDVNFLKQ